MTEGIIFLIVLFIVNPGSASVSAKTPKIHEAVRQTQEIQIVLVYQQGSFLEQKTNVIFSRLPHADNLSSLFFLTV